MTEHLLGCLYKGSVGGTEVFAYGIGAAAGEERVIAGVLIFYRTFMVIGMTDSTFFHSGEEG